MLVLMQKMFGITSNSKKTDPATILLTKANMKTMKFSHNTFEQIKEDCIARKEILLTVKKDITDFHASTSTPPDEWTAYPPALLTEELYDEIFACAGNSWHGVFMAFVLQIHLDGGRVFYMADGKNDVGVKITWPKLSKS